MIVAEQDQFLEVAEPYVGRWSRLVSTTNWEKGEIIRAWRDELISRGSPAREYSDDTWAQHVGSVSPQHVGRLRRVAERFGEVHEEYDGLYWSHFQAVLDWDDAELWLQGAVENGWSVKAMQTQRWESLGAPDELKPRDEDIVTAQFDEDVDPRLDPASGVVDSDVALVRSPEQEAESAGEPHAADELPPPPPTTAADKSQPPTTAALAELPDLPDDLVDAFESFKLSILRHKMSAWQEVAADDVLLSLDALKRLVLAPSGE